MNRLLDVFRLIPKSGRIIALLLVFGFAVYFVYYEWGIVPAIVLAAGILLVFLLIMGYNLVVKASEKQNGAAFGKAMNNAQNNQYPTDVDDVDLFSIELCVLGCDACMELAKDVEMKRWQHLMTLSQEQQLS